jgi:nucleoside-diphosphate-sugar epimerase
VLGATSFVGRALVPRLEREGWRVVPVSRSGSPAVPVEAAIPFWIAICPIWAVPEHFARLEAHGAKRLVALSSTSRFTKHASADASEREVAQKIASAEEAVQDWGAARGVSTVILRPTLIYDGLHDKNIALIASFIRRRGWFPVLGAASGLRQPVHVDDVAAACAAALTAGAPQAAYDLSGAETLSYRNLVGRVAVAVGENPRVVALPRWAVRLALPVLRLLPAFRGISVGMFDRMNDDLVFEHSAARRDLGFEPRAFRLPEGRYTEARRASEGWRRSE